MYYWTIVLKISSKSLQTFLGGPGMNMLTRAWYLAYPGLDLEL